MVVFVSMVETVHHSFISAKNQTLKTWNRFHACIYIEYITIVYTSCRNSKQLLIIIIESSDKEDIITEVVSSKGRNSEFLTKGTNFFFTKYDQTPHSLSHLLLLEKSGEVLKIQRVRQVWAYWLSKRLSTLTY